MASNTGLAAMHRQIIGNVNVDRPDAFDSRDVLNDSVMMEGQNDSVQCSLASQHIINGTWHLNIHLLRGFNADENDPNTLNFFILFGLWIFEYSQRSYRESLTRCKRALDVTCAKLWTTLLQLIDILRMSIKIALGHFLNHAWINLRHNENIVTTKEYSELK